MKIIFWLISALASFPAVILGLVYFFIYDFNVFPALVLGVIMTTIATLILRTIIHTERPDPKRVNKLFFHNRLHGRRLGRLKEHLEKINNRTFASNHVARIGVFLSVLYLNNYSFNWLFTILLFMVLIALMRILLRRHRFIDVMIGAVLGVAAGYCSFYIFSNYIFI